MEGRLIHCCRKERSCGLKGWRAVRVVWWWRASSLGLSAMWVMTCTGSAPTYCTLSISHEYRVQSATVSRRPHHPQCDFSICSKYTSLSSRLPDLDHPMHYLQQRSLVDHPPRLPIQPVGTKDFERSGRRSDGEWQLRDVVPLGKLVLHNLPSRDDRFSARCCSKKAVVYSRCRFGGGGGDCVRAASWLVACKLRIDLCCRKPPAASCAGSSHHNHTYVLWLREAIQLMVCRITWCQVTGLGVLRLKFPYLTYLGLYF